jgi:putative oxidoreductase
MKGIFLLGRIVFGGFFLYNGINHIKERESMQQYAASKNVPNPEFAIPVSAALLILGGASVISGFKPKLGTLALIAFLATVSPTMHDFWSADDPNQKQNQLIHFSKNIALLGAALALAGVEEPWPAGVS